MAKLIPEELDALLQEYLTDGVISPRERKVLLKKAASLGLDVEEIDLYIDAQEQKVSRAMTAKVEHQRGMKCPHCAAQIPLLTDKCPECGNFILPDTSTELTEIIETLEDALVNMKSGQDFAHNKAKVEKNLRKAELYYSNNPKVKILIGKINEEIKSASKRKTKEDFKSFISKHWRLLVFCVLVLIEIIFMIGYNASSDNYLSNYHNNIGNRMDMWAHHKSSAHSATMAGVFLFFTIMFGIIYGMTRLAQKENNKKNK